MDRAEAAGAGVAVAGHAALLAALTFGFANASQPPIMTPPIKVSFIDEVALQSAVTEASAEPSAQSVAPDAGASEEAAPQPVETPARPQLAPPQPAPKAVEVPPEPKPTPKPVAKPAPARPAPKAAAKPAPARPAAKPAAVKAASRPAPAKAAPARSNQTGTAKATTGSRLGSDFLKGIGSDPSPSRSQRPSGAVMSARASADIGTAILRQVQPCANRQVTPGPGAERIRVTIRLLLDRDGSLSGRPRVTGRTGLDDENRRYADRVEDMAIATFMGCSPLKGLPLELYDVKNGWKDFSLRYQLPG